MISINRLCKAYDRFILANLYAMGNRVVCPYCDWSGWKFLPAGARRVPNRLCPRCSSLERYRMLLLYLQRQQGLMQRNLRILDLAPKDCFRYYMQRQPNVTYISSDLMSPVAMLFSDLTRMGIASQSFELIICSHVLEHIPDDRAAFFELGRILAPGGFGMLMVPIRGETTFEEPTARPEEYERLYGQNDHVRWYGLDIADRMRAAGLQVQVLDMFQFFGEQACRRYALFGEDRYYFRFSK